MPNPPESHDCKARCQLCDEGHPTADRTCKARYKTPFLVRKCRWERARQEQENASLAAQDRPSHSNAARDNISESSPSLPHERKSRSRSKNCSRSRNRYRSKSHSQSRAKEPRNPGADTSLKVSWADRVKGTRAEAEAASDQKVAKLEAESIVAVAGDDFAVIASDSRLSSGYHIHTREQSKLFKL
ncbi:hypothetical protein HPB51_029723 [Rhipicephalus microplus]|uniref:Uncharacterized protein n=1 Tax=Rhipicephalus microplus TaxID=6941 RepID=A0A9J6CT75_RHIMP|nr:hypothetical protein HPB51_029723 [Rhipicephalus microplus]